MIILMKENITEPYADSSQGFHLMDKKNIRHGDGKSTSLNFAMFFLKRQENYTR